MTMSDDVSTGGYQLCSLGIPHLLCGTGVHRRCVQCLMLELTSSLDTGLPSDWSSLQAGLAGAVQRAALMDTAWRGHG